MQTELDIHLKNLLGVPSLESREVIQSLWSGYGSIRRFTLETDEAIKTVVVKHVQLPDGASHPRGWNTPRSHLRKIHSYHVESAWYRNYSHTCDAHCRVPQCFALEETGDEQFLMVLEDLDASGFDQRKTHASLENIYACLSWLAHFHAKFMGANPEGLWKEGCYWHLDTRPDELEALDDLPLKHVAAAIERRLSASPFQTFVHGDAKLANFCFAADGQVAAVDFQYVGGGCGMKDVAYFIGSCLDEDACVVYEEQLLDHYFAALKNAISVYQPMLDAQALEADWRPLFEFAWADFHRFLKGWSPGHWKLHRYSEQVTKRVLKTLGVS